MQDRDCNRIPIPAGDDVFPALCQECYPTLYRLAYRLLGDKEEAADVCQDAFLRLYQALGAAKKQVEQPLAWLCRTVANLCCDRWRRKGRFRRLFLTCEHLPPAAPSAEETAQQDEENRQVRAALVQLSRRDRLLLALYQKNCRYADMARITGLKETSVGKALSRALCRLERRLSSGERL